MPKNQTYLTATGIIRYRMTNDFMFRAILQKNQKVLRGLVSALLHMQPEEIENITIENPIDLGDSVEEKELILDIRITLNNQMVINLEMQVTNRNNWTDRSLLYLCRAYNQLEAGEDYRNILPTIHIGFLDFLVFPEYPEFFATYKLLNTKNYHLYSDKFILHVVDLTCINLATDEDKAYNIDHWARLFKATTWEELRMLAKDNEYMDEAAQTLYKYNSDALIREQCRARETRLFFERATQAKIEELTEENTQLTNENTLLTEALAEKDASLAEKDAEIARLKAQIANQK